LLHVIELGRAGYFPRLAVARSRTAGPEDCNMMDELVAAVARAADLPPERASLAVAAVLRFFTARLPSALVGELHAQLQTPVQSPWTPPRRHGSDHDPEPTR
jgi:uncharacterized protein (DUF2267 family)